MSRTIPRIYVTYRVGRAIGFAVWFWLSALAPAKALGNVALIFFLIPMGFLLFGFNGLMSLYTDALKRATDRTTRALAQHGKVVAVVGKQLDSGIAFVVSLFMAFFAAVAGGYAVLHPGLRPQLVAMGTLAVETLIAYRAILHRTTASALTLGVDGVSLPDRSFISFASIRDVEVSNDDDGALRIHQNDGSTRSVVMPVAAATVLRDEILRRQEVESELPGRTQPEATDFRSAAVPIDEMVRTLRDAEAPREERIRVAGLLRVHAPTVVDHLERDTADEELEEALRGVR